MLVHLYDVPVHFSTGLFRIAFPQRIENAHMRLVYLDGKIPIQFELQFNLDNRVFE
jgi:hypothetical protein